MSTNNPSVATIHACPIYMNTITPSFNPMPRYDGSLGLIPHPGEIARINRVNKHRAELWNQIQKVPPKVVERVTESDACWLPPITYTMNGVVSWGTHPLRVGLIVNETV